MFGRYECKSELIHKYINKGDEMICITRIILLKLCALTLIVFSFGCDQSMTKPVMEVISPTDPPTKTAIQRAREAMERVNQRRTESLQKADTAGDYLVVFTDSEIILNEEFAFRKAFWVELVDIYKDEKREDSTVLDGFTSLEDRFARRLEENTLGKFYFEYIRTFDPLIIEYLRLSYVYPTATEKALLVRFRNSINDGKVTVTFPENF